MFKKIVIFLFIVFNSKISISEVNVNQTFTGNDCYTLNTVKLSKNGYVVLKINSGNDSSCKANKKIYYIETFLQYPNKGAIVKKNTIRKVIGITANKLEPFFYLHVLPTTSQINISGNNERGREEIGFIDIRAFISKLKEIESKKNWLNNLNASEEKLVEKKNSDKTPPKISIFNLKNNQRLDTYNLFVRGKVTDNQGILSVFVNGKKSGIKSDGTFASKVKLGLGKNKIKIQAEDVNNNVAEKSITIIREEYISELTLADVDIPPKTTMNNSDGLAVVIGIENYQYVPDATYAYNDAEVFREYLSQTLGYKKQRIKLATNSKATQAELNKLLGSNGWISRNIVKGKSDVVVYFSGHGIANQKDKSTGILPFDVDPNYSVGLPLKKLYKDLASMGAKSVTVYLDACFTGQTRDAKMLIADARPIIILPKEKATPDNVNVFSAASGSQISGAIKEKEHGLFTYFLLKGLSGDADLNKDKVVKLDELSQFVLKNVKENAALNGREQTPELNSKNNEVLVKFP